AVRDASCLEQVVLPVKRLVVRLFIRCCPKPGHHLPGGQRLYHAGGGLVPAQGKQAALQVSFAEHQQSRQGAMLVQQDEAGWRLHIVVLDKATLCLERKEVFGKRLVIEKLGGLERQGVLQHGGNLLEVLALAVTDGAVDLCGNVRVVLHQEAINQAVIEGLNGDTFISHAGQKVVPGVRFR